VDAVDLTHGGFDVEGLDVVPVLLQEGNQEIDRHHAVVTEFIVAHGNVSDGDTHAQHLLELEFDVRLELSALLFDVIVVGDQSRELTGLVQAGTQQTRNLRDEHLGGQEGIVLAGQFLDELLALVQFLEILHGLEIITELGGLVAMDSITEDADLHARAANVRKLDGTCETLITLGVVILKADLEIDGLHELALLLLAPLQDIRQGGPEGFNVQLRHVGCWFGARLSLPQIT